MKIVSVETVKDPEMGWCYVVTTLPGNGNASPTKTVYVVLKPVFDRQKTRIFPPHVDLTENGRWEKLFNFKFDMSCATKREYLERISSFKIQLGKRFGNFEQPQESKKNTPYRVFRILNKKGLSL